MVSAKIQKQLNDMINIEMNASYFYLSMSSFFKSQNLDGFSGWFKRQSKEEWEHAMKFYDFLHERGGVVKLDAISAPKATWKSAKDAFEEALTQEQKMTKIINDFYGASLDEKDHATSIFLQWFVTEQVEEEDHVTTVVQKFKLIGDSSSALYMLNKELAKSLVTK